MLGRHFADLLRLDRILVIPTKLPPHKAASATPGDMRLEMCRLAVRGDRVMEASDIELRRDGLSYSYITVCSLREMYPDDELYLIIGADMFMILETWYEYDELKKLVTFCTVPRDDTDAAELREYAKKLESDGARTFISDGMKIDLSSTGIRTARAQGRSIEGMTPETVEWYILANRLYQPQSEYMTAVERERYTALVRSKLRDARFIHSVNVSREAVRLAKKYGADPYKAELAGLLHDVEKESPKERQRSLITSGGMWDDDMAASPRVWHGFAAAQYIAGELCITDPDICNAVRYHTTARAGMSLLEKIIYIADFTSAERDYPDVDIVRGKADVSLDDAIRYTLAYTVGKLSGEGLPIHPQTIAAYDDFDDRAERRTEE